MHVERAGHFHLPLDPDTALDHFTAEGESAWVPGWEPEALHAPGGTLSATGAVFRTAVGGEETLWIVLRFDREARVAEYARLTPGSRLGTVHVAIEAAPDGGSRVEVAYRLTSLSAAGAEVLAKLTPEAYTAMLADWRSKIVALTTSSGPGH